MGPRHAERRHRCDPSVSDGQNGKWPVLDVMAWWSHFLLSIRSKWGRFSAPFACPVWLPPAGADMSQTVGEFIVARLGQWGIDRIFGYPGDGINGVFAALRKAEGHPRFIQARHEELAAFMACAHAKFTGEVGICLATSGPGAIHLLNGLYDAKMDHPPVVAIIGP